MNLDPRRLDRFDGVAEGSAEHVLEGHQPVAARGQHVQEGGVDEAGDFRLDRCATLGVRLLDLF
jgi:hypothetical protein